ncbi:MAG: pre-peptidase [Planctomycetaceae bacterium]|nr:pre-peptidase [Planctomycetaceae bacterium]
MTRLIELILLGSLLVVGHAHGAAPDVKSLNPPGVQRGQSVEVTVGGNLGTRPVKAWCDRAGVAISIPEKGSKVTLTAAPSAQPGLCWIRFHNAEGASSLRPFVIGTLPDVAEQEPNDRPGEAQQLPSTQVVVNGVLAKAGDADLYAVPLKAGQTLVASLAAHRVFGSPMDGVLQVVSPEGFVLEQNDDARDFDPQIVFTARRDGVYVVRAFAFPATPNSTIRLAGGADYIYRLTLTTGAFASHVVPMSITRGSTTAVRLSGWNIPSESREIPVALDADANRALVADTVLGNAIELPVVEHTSLGEDESAAKDGPQAISVPSSVTGRIDATDDVDGFVFPAKKGEKLTFRVESRSLGFPLDAVLELFDAQRKSLARVDDPSRGAFDAVLDYTVKADGEHRIVVSDLYGHAGPRHVYLLTAELQVPDFVLTAAMDKFVLRAGEPLEILVTVTRRRGFAEKIGITAEGLPTGVSVAVVESVVKQKSEKSVELVLTAEKPVAVDGPFAIVGRSSGAGGSTVRRAKAPVAGLTEKTSALWLTVGDGGKK